MSTRRAYFPCLIYNCTILALRRQKKLASLGLIGPSEVSKWTHCLVSFHEIPSLFFRELSEAQKTFLQLAYIPFSFLSQTSPHSAYSLQTNFLCPSFFYNFSPFYNKKKFKIITRKQKSKLPTPKLQNLYLRKSSQYTHPPENHKMLRIYIIIIKKCRQKLGS